jgi:PAS domain S-box-containing protein
MREVAVHRAVGVGESVERTRGEERRHGERRMGRGRRAGERARESQAAFRELIELAADAVVVSDPDHRVTDVNAAACKLYGYSREEFLGKSAKDIDPEVAERVEREVPSVPGQVYVAEWRVKRRDGTFVPIEASVTILPDRRHLALFRDITDRKRAERERDEALRWMRAVVEQSPVGLALLHGPGGAEVEFNARGQHMLGERTPGESRARIRTLEGQPLDPDESPTSRALRGETVQAEILAPNAGGGFTPLAVRAGPIAGPDGTVVGAVAAFEDITARKELERLRAEWGSVVAHDLRQPLASISLSAQSLARATGDAKLVKYAERIHAAANRLNRMVADLMDLSRLDARRLELVRQRVDVPTLASASIERMALQVPERAFDLHALGDVPDADADPDRIAQVMDNLLTNAVKYGRRGTPITVSVSSEDGAVVVAMTNEGRPLTAEELVHIFERFHRTASAKLEGIEGVGLGLYITRSLVEAHGGCITAESTPAGRTTFRFTLPAARD